MAEAEDRFERAREQAAAQFHSILQMVTRLQTAEEQAEDGPDETDAAREDIESDALSVMVRSGWAMIGAKLEPEEYEILLSTGGPAVRIVGKLGEYNEPISASLEMQDWFTPWVEACGFDFPDGVDFEETLLAYACVFYFGE